MNEQQWREAVETTKEGDKKAFEKLYSSTQRAVYFTCLKLLANEETAKDVMQDTFMTALDKLDTLKDGANFPKWINRIAVNNCMHQFRHKQVDSLDEKLEQGADFKDDESFIPEEYAANEAKRKIIMDIITTQLSDVQRYSVIMYYYDEMSLEEIAQAMDCPVKTVSSRLCTAREKIKKEVVSYENKHGDRLHMLIPVPILAEILRREAESTCVPDISQALLSSHFFSAAANASASTTSAVVAGGSKFVGFFTAKVVAAIAAGVIAVGGITTALVLSKSGKNSDSSSISASSSVSAADKSSSGTKTDASSKGDADSSKAEAAPKVYTGTVSQFKGVNLVLPPRYKEESGLSGRQCRDYGVSSTYLNEYYGVIQLAYETADSYKSYTTDKIKEYFDKNTNHYELYERVTNLFFLDKQNIETTNKITIAGKEFIRETGTYNVTCENKIKYDVSYATLYGKLDFKDTKDNIVCITAYSIDTDPAKKKELETTIDNIAKGLGMNDTDAAAFAQTIKDDYLTFTNVEHTTTAPNGTKGNMIKCGVYNVLVPQG